MIGISRTIICEYLRSAGFDVLEAKTADETLAQLAANPGIDIMMTNVFLAGDTDDFALARSIEADFRIPVVRTSGTAASSEADFDGWGGRFVKKPYVHADVERRLRELLARRGK